MPSHLSFDLDGTLIRDKGDKQVWNESIPQAYADQHSVTVDEAKRHVYAEYYRANFIEDIDDFTEIHYWVNRLGLDQANDFFNTMADLTSPYDDLNRLRTLNDEYTLTLFTNSTRGLMEAKLQRMPFNDFQKTISAPTDYDSNKRRTHAWERYLDDIKAPRESIVHIGDRPLDDVTIPGKVGVDAYLLDRTGESRDAFTSLHDIHTYFTR